MKTIVVTGTDTEVGKTYVSCQLIRLLRDAGISVGAWKPVCSGAVKDASGQPGWEDVEALAAAVGENTPRDLICPQRFEAAVAPNVAAELEGRVVDESLIHHGPREWESKAGVVIIEGAGGLLSPLSESLTTADVAREHGDSVIIVAANRLGVINHTLLTVEVARTNGLHIAAVVLNDVLPTQDDPSTLSNFTQLTNLLTNVAVYRLCNQGHDLLSSCDKVVDMVDVLRLRSEVRD